MNYIATTIEQSRRLLMAGIPAKTADMHYHIWNSDFVDGKYIPKKYDLEVGNEQGFNIVPAWSIGKLCTVAHCTIQLPMSEMDVENLVRQVILEASMMGYK